jgi:hypothetical protein
MAEACEFELFEDIDFDEKMEIDDEFLSKEENGEVIVEEEDIYKADQFQLQITFLCEENIPQIQIDGQQEQEHSSLSAPSFSCSVCGKRYKRENYKIEHEKICGELYFMLF